MMPLGRFVAEHNTGELGEEGGVGGAGVEGQAENHQEVQGELEVRVRAAGGSAGH
jgi:hypothetical protein